MKCYCGHFDTEHNILYLGFSRCSLCICMGFSARIAASVPSDESILVTVLYGSEECYCFVAPVEDCPNAEHAERARRARKGT